MSLSIIIPSSRMWCRWRLIICLTTLMLDFTDRQSVVRHSKGDLILLRGNVRVLKDQGHMPQDICTNTPIHTPNIHFTIQEKYSTIISSDIFLPPPGPDHCDLPAKTRLYRNISAIWFVPLKY